MHMREKVLVGEVAPSQPLTFPTTRKCPLYPLPTRHLTVTTL